MTGETSGPSAQDIRMASFEEKFNDLLNFVCLLVKRDTENERQAADNNKDTSEDNTGGHSHTNLGPPPVQPSKPEKRDFQLDAKVEKTMRNTKMVDASALPALAKPDVENEARTINPNATPENDPSPKGNWNTLEGPQSLQMYGNVMNKKEDDHSDIRSLQGQPLYPSNQGDTIEPHFDIDGHSSKGSEEFEKEAQSPISKKEEPKEVDHPMIPHKRYTPKNVVERVEQLEKRLDEVVQSMHQLITLTGTLLKDNRKAIRDLASHSPRGQASTKSLSKRETRRHRRQETLTLHTGRYQSVRNLSTVAKLKSESRKFCTLPMPMDELYPRLLEKRLISPVFLKQSPHLLHDSSKKCEFHFGRPGHSLEDCHALKSKVQDLVDHGILRINEGSTPSVIIAWPPEHCKDETVIPSPQSQGPTTCGIQPVHLTMLPTLLEVGEHTVPKTQPKLMSNFRNLDDQCSSDKEKAEYCTNRCVTLKRKIQELGHSELEVPTMVQARKPSMHTVPMKKARSTLGFRANGPSRDQTERTISRSTGAWIPHRQG
uniref:Retrotransposon gag domain-containing protein n=1 Tax=Fagus sylvatica TaxID=28930 RepID=A0A2N9EKQ8_FAGSY